jgi:hypothetical protein
VGGDNRREEEYTGIRYSNDISSHSRFVVGFTGLDGGLNYSSIGTGMEENGRELEELQRNFGDKTVDQWENHFEQICIDQIKIKSDQRGRRSSFSRRERVRVAQILIQN